MTNANDQRPATNDRLEVSRIADQMRRAYSGDAWHGPSLSELLRGVDAAVAAAHPLHGAHSIWELVLHVTAWKKAVHRRMHGEAIELTGADDWPPVTDTREAAWKRACDALAEAHRELLADVSRFERTRLTETVPGKDYDFYHLLHGAVQHDLYHAGQIALLKKGF
jgi:uncharacterized damage-inducible protein DinB